MSSIIDEMELRDSNWIFRKIVSCEILIFDVRDERASSYIKSPFQSRSILNIQNKDNRCFAYSILAHIYYNEVDKTNRTRSSIYNKYFEQNQYLNELNYPMKIKDISKLENKIEDLSINVFGIQRKYYQKY